MCIIKGLNLEMFVIYNTTLTHLEKYTLRLCTLFQKLVSTSKKDVIVFSSNLKMSIGKPRKNQIREDGNGCMIKKKDSTLRYSNCKRYGHNSRTCQRDNAKQISGDSSGRTERGSNIGVKKGLKGGRNERRSSSSDRKGSKGGKGDASASFQQP